MYTTVATDNNTTRTNFYVGQPVTVAYGVGRRPGIVVGLLRKNIRVLLFRRARKSWNDKPTVVRPRQIRSYVVQTSGPVASTV